MKKIILPYLLIKYSLKYELIPYLCGFSNEIAKMDNLRYTSEKLSEYNIGYVDFPKTYLKNNSLIVFNNDECVELKFTNKFDTFDYLNLNYKILVEYYKGLNDGKKPDEKIFQNFMEFIKKLNPGNIKQLRDYASFFVYEDYVSTNIQKNKYDIYFEFYNNNDIDLIIDYNTNKLGYEIKYKKLNSKKALEIINSKELEIVINIK